MVVQRTLTPPVGVRSSHPQPVRSRSTLLRFFITGCSAVGSALGSGPRGRGFESRHSDHEPVTKKMSQAYFFAVSLKNGDFANQFLDTVLQCCPTILGRFAHLDAHFSADFWNLAGEGAIFLRKNRINPAVFFQNVFNFPQPISHWTRFFRFLQLLAKWKLHALSFLSPLCECVALRAGGQNGTVDYF